MQDRYAGDVGDYGKYGLLRGLIGEHPPLRLGIIWYLTDNRTVASDPVNDGRHTSYAYPQNAERFRPCNPDLYDAMKRILRGRRSVAAVERLGVFPSNTIFFSERLKTPEPYASRDIRQAERDSWIAAAARRIQPCDLVFVDPDNGLDTPSVPPYSVRSPKYAYMAELKQLISPERSLVIYHHLGRRKHTLEIQERLAQCRDELKRDVFALRFHRGTSRAFLIAPAPRHRALLHEQAERLLSGPWGEHFERVPSA